MKTRIIPLVILSLLIGLSACKKSPEALNDNFDMLPDRIWIGKNYWAVPMEDWQVKNHRLECNGSRPEERVNILTHLLTGRGKLSLTVEAGLIAQGKSEGTAGFWVGMQDRTDNHVKSLCYFGRGVNIGLHTGGHIFVDSVTQELPDNFDLSAFTLNLEATSDENGAMLLFKVTDVKGKSAEIQHIINKPLKGMVALLNNNYWVDAFEGGPSFWFDNLKMSGSMVEYQPDNSFGPILWSMYTLSRGKLKMTVQMPPVGSQDDQTVELQIKKDDKWVSLGESVIDTAARIAVFSISDWDASRETGYRLVYSEVPGNAESDYFYEGIIRREPIDQPFTLGGLTCQEHQGFPYRPLTESLAKANPDMLYFSGDQIYEANGGYSIIRFPADRAILNYLGKWYMFGWAFGDLMRDRPTVCIPDDHEVYQGNLWGNGGKAVSSDEWNKATDCTSGFVEPADMVKVVMQTNCSHLPDPYDPTPMEQNIPVYYTDLVYGRISFAIVGDRIFKSGPEHVSWWEGRKDHIKQPVSNLSQLEKPGLQFLGERQEAFLSQWVTDWKGADMKVLLSQTIFANASTHHGAEKMFLFGDMDSGGWPQSGRARALRIIRKAFALHICGDQHLPTLVQYGVDSQRDASWVFCTPAISVGYQRRFLPDTLGWKAANRPEHNLPNTGEYTDVFGNHFYIYAVGNPVDSAFDANRYRQAWERSSGYGLIRFDQQERTIEFDAVRFPFDSVASHQDHKFPGWPLKISQFDNYSRKAVAWLPQLVVEGLNNAVVKITNETSGELEFAVRMKGNRFSPGVYASGKYTIEIGEPDQDKWQRFESVRALKMSQSDSIVVKF